MTQTMYAHVNKKKKENFQRISFLPHFVAERHMYWNEMSN
jgi:hypothetical protein